MTFVSKTSQVKAAIQQGDRKAALKLASDFRIGVTEAQRKALKKGYECLVWPDQYRQMRVDVEEAVSYAWTLLCTLPVITGAAS
jgi:hypothetical protein